MIRPQLRLVPPAQPDPDALVAELGPLVWSLCRRLDPDPEDAAQEVWEKVLLALHRWDPAGEKPIAAWVTTITHRHLVDRHRRRLVRGPTVEPIDVAAAAPGPERLAASRQAAQRLEAALPLLAAEHRRVIVLHHLHGVGLDEIAAAEEVAIGTIKSRLHRARARLMDALGGAL
jgi:RNA polymerase sigma-70 factor (ECF subfamily)